MPAKYYYFIEDLDVTNDKIPDGILVRQVTIKNNIINYHKNMFITENTLITIGYTITRERILGATRGI